MTVYFSCKIKLESMFTKDFGCKLYALSFNPSSCLLLSKISSKYKPALQIGHLSGLGINVDVLISNNLGRDSLLKLCLGLYMTVFFLSHHVLPPNPSSRPLNVVGAFTIVFPISRK